MAVVEINGEFTKEAMNVMRFKETKTLETNRILQNLMVTIMQEGAYLPERCSASTRRMTKMRRRRPMGRSLAAIPLSSRPSKGKATGIGNVQ